MNTFVTAKNVLNVSEHLQNAFKMEKSSYRINNLEKNKVYTYFIANDIIHIF